jgi:hypothetical protein
MKMETYPDFKLEDVKLIEEITQNQLLKLTKNSVKVKI